MSHVDHDPVDPELVLVIRYDPHDLVPQGAVDVLRLREPRVVHPDRIVADIVEIRVRVHPQICHIPPGGLVVVRRPVGERTGDPHTGPVGQPADIAPLFTLHTRGVRWRGEEGTVYLVRRQQVPQPPLFHVQVNLLQLLLRE